MNHTGGREMLCTGNGVSADGYAQFGLAALPDQKRETGSVQQIEKTLHLPQYLSYLFTGKYYADHTSIGCHTAMWNFQENRYHRWLK
jgi:sugar (pentulose or hexulose) kinase